VDLFQTRDAGLLRFAEFAKADEPCSADAIFRGPNHHLVRSLVLTIFVELRDLEELMTERGLASDHTTVFDISSARTNVVDPYLREQFHSVVMLCESGRSCPVLPIVI
jgi:hypothetical protein